MKNVKQTIHPDVISLTSQGTGTWTPLTDLECSISPTSSTNDIKITFTINSSSEIDNCILRFLLYQQIGSGAISVITNTRASFNGSNRIRATIGSASFGNGSHDVITSSITAIISPNTTSAVKIIPHYEMHSGGVGFINRGDNGGNFDSDTLTISSLVLEEIMSS